MQDVQMLELKRIYKAYLQTPNIAELISGIETMQAAYAGKGYPAAGKNGKLPPRLKREDLALVGVAHFGQASGAGGSTAAGSPPSPATRCGSW